MSDIDLFDPAVQEDWFPTYRRLRDDHPVWRVPGSNLFVGSRYDDVLHVLRHQELFPTGGSAVRSAAARRVYESTGWPRITPLSTNPPEHRLYRELVDGHFDPRGSLQWQPFIEQVIDELARREGISGLVEKAARTKN